MLIAIDCVIITHMILSGGVLKDIFYPMVVVIQIFEMKGIHKNDEKNR